MIRFGFALLLGLCCSVANTALAQGDAYLLNVGKGEIPSDTGMDDKTVLSLVDFPKLDGKAVKVPLAAEDSFGVKTSAVTDWTKYSQFRLNAFNPNDDAIDLELVVLHARSRNYQTRIVQPIRLEPGRNQIALPVNVLSNVNGSEPDLANVNRWYIADVSKLELTFYVGDIWLEGAKAAAPVPGPAPVPASNRESSPLLGYRLRGKVGTMDVDLTLTPFVVPAGEEASGETPPSIDARPDVGIQRDPAAPTPIRSSRKPAITEPISFDTPEADAIVSAMPIFPADNPWNLEVADWPVHPNSASIIASIGEDDPLRYNTDMAYVIVPPNQKKVAVKIVEIPEESDPGPFPVPDNVPIEGWPVAYQRENSPLTLDDVQRNASGDDGDRHGIVVDPTSGMLYEFYRLEKTARGWQASQSSIFNLKSNKLRPDGWTSADAAGLPIFPAVVRFDELQRGVINHALRVTVEQTRRAYVYPATHFASPYTVESLPRMGERIRLRSDYDVSGHSPGVQTILTALQKYGMLVADNGIDWAVSVTPDPRIPEFHEELRKVKGSDFEVVEPPAGYTPPQ